MRYRQGVGTVCLWTVFMAFLMAAGGCKPAGKPGGGEYTAAAVECKSLEGHGETGGAEADGELQRPVQGKIKREEPPKPEPAEDTEAVRAAISFSDPVVEEQVREILQKPEGDIAPWEVLSVTDLQLGYDIESFEDLRWFFNLESVSAMLGNLKSLEGIENLKKLQVLKVRCNKFMSLEPVRNLKELRELDCAFNDIRDYGPLAGLVNLKRLCIGNNGRSFTDLSPLKELKNLESFYGPRCGIRDISVFSGMEGLEYLQLSYNEIQDISPLAGLNQLAYAELSNNRIKDITPLKNLDKLTYVNLQENEILQEELKKFYEQDEKSYFITTVRAALKEGMEEFTFDIDAALHRETSAYMVRSITVSQNGQVRQVISIPELTCFGQTAVYFRENMGLVLEDVNFDGYKDIRLFDTQNGAYGERWIYLVWDPGTGRFEHDPGLSDISLAVFDQEEKCIRGTVRGSAIRHYYDTYKYIGGEVILTAREDVEFIVADEEAVDRYLAGAGLDRDGADVEIRHKALSERNPETGQLELVTDQYEYVFTYLETGRKRTVMVAPEPEFWK